MPCLFLLFFHLKKKLWIPAQIFSMLIAHNGRSVIFPQSMVSDS